MEITISNEHVYKIGKLNARQQFHVARKIGPAVFELYSARAKAAASIPKGATEENAGTEEAVVMANFVKVMAVALAQMSEADTNYIIDICLGVCERQQPGGWQRVLSSSGNFMFQDIDLRIMFRLAIEVIKENLGGFFAAPLEAMV